MKVTQLELFKWPLFTYLIRCVGAIAIINAEDAKDAIKMLAGRYPNVKIEEDSRVVWDSYGQEYPVSVEQIDLEKRGIICFKNEGII